MNEGQCDGLEPPPQHCTTFSVSSNKTEKQTSASLKPWFLCFPVMGAARGDAPLEGGETVMGRRVSSFKILMSGF